MDFESWLDNFLPGEREHAIALLNSFVFIPDEITKQLFQASFHAISSEICRSNATYREAQQTWKRFVDRLIVTRITGEIPNDAESGFYFVRLARQILGIDEKQIMSPQDALAARLASPDRPLVFVDDFLGSGEQFKETWGREYWVGSLAASASFDAVCRKSGAEVIYCVLVSTEKGIQTVRAAAPKVKIEAAHVLGDLHAVHSPNSLCWPDHLRATAQTFIKNASSRANISERDCFGFHKLGLTLAFEHSVPDATIPLIHTNSNGWKPLRRRE